MRNPSIKINLDKIAYNTKTLKELYGSKGIDIVGVTKVVSGDTDMTRILVKSGINIIGDSRIANIKKMHKEGIVAQFMLLRTPMLSEAKEVIKYADISLNSELKVLKQLSKIALESKVIHKVILMVELGDLREGIMPSDIEDVVCNTIKEKGIEIIGIGANLACLGGISPDDKNMAYLSMIAGDIEKKFGLRLNIISGGNSANFNWFMSTKDVGRINNLRLGESIFLGIDPLYGKPIPGLYTDAFKLVVEVIESKIKPSLTTGTVRKSAFGKVLDVKDNGLTRRVILGAGLQDVMVSGLTPYLNIEIISCSSDHIIVNTKKTNLQVGDTVEFNLNYGALLSAMASPYITKNKYIK